MEKKYDVVTLGETLIDFASCGTSEQGNDLFEACPGGAPCNVLAMLKQLDRRVAFIGKVGADQFGRQLVATMEQVGIETAGVCEDADSRTTLAFVHTFADGDRDFSFYRNPGADMCLRPEEVPLELIQGARVFHFGTLSMTDSPVREATQLALETARKSGALISFDPNLREPLWRSLADAKAAMEYGFARCDVLKISDNEICFATGCEDYDEGIRRLQERYEIPLIFLTLGKDGSRAYQGERRVTMPGAQVQTIETTGAGDTFTACAIDGVLTYGLAGLTDDRLREILAFANAAAALVTTKKGAILAMPTRAEAAQLSRQLR